MMVVGTPSVGEAATPAQVLEFMDLLAYLYLRHDMPHKAAVLLSARDVLAPDNARVLLTWAVALVRSAKPAQALQTLERLAMLGLMGAEFHLVRAQALQALARNAEAASAMRAYVRMAPPAVLERSDAPVPFA